MKAWITKFIFNSGIIEALCVREMDISDEFSEEVTHEYELQDKYGLRYLLLRQDFEFDYKSAIKRAEEMRKKKIESLKKQIKKLEEMRFE